MCRVVASSGRVWSCVLEVTVATENVKLLPELESYIARILREDEIDEERRVLLESLSDHVVSKLADGQPARLVFICTHNSRRSHMSQLWAQTAAAYYSVGGVETFSGGTETTAFNPLAVAALRRAGFSIEPFTDGKNPIYEVRYEPEMEPIQAFSKHHDSPPNPEGGFAAIMTCLSADAECPTVAGADERIAILYGDPKEADGSECEAEIYDTRCRQIAREMLGVFSQVAARQTRGSSAL
jgi:arsenate reductase (thioredoxin)